MSTRKNNTSVIEKTVLSRAKDGELPCAVAFSIAADLNVSPGQVGMVADELKIRLTKCQLGLFGYKPDKKILKSASHVDERLHETISNALSENRISCKAIWDIAADLSIPKMKVSAGCEAMGVKIKKCQLGAF